MEWLIDKRSKSVASSAQRVVADMHRDLDLQKKKVADLEELVSNLTELCTDSLESEIFRLELRRKELLLELERTDTAIQDRQHRLENARDDIRNILISSDQGHNIAEGLNASSYGSNDKAETPIKNPKTLATASKMTRASAALSVPPTSGKGLSMNNSQNSIPNASSSRFVANRSRTTSAELRSVELEEAYMEETEMLSAVREVLASSTSTEVLFVVHMSYLADVIVYVPSEVPESVLHCHKISEFQDDVADPANRSNIVAEEIFTSELSNFDYMTTYGPKLVPNHERDYPHVCEMVVPVMNSHVQSSSDLGPVKTTNDSNGEESVGTLVGAVQLPLIPDVIIDVWKSRKGHLWATTTIDGVSFSVLERIFMVSESSWGVNKITQIDIFGRHPSKKYLVVEHVTA